MSEETTPQESYDTPKVYASESFKNLVAGLTCKHEWTTGRQCKHCGYQPVTWMTTKGVYIDTSYRWVHSPGRVVAFGLLVLRGAIEAAFA